MPTAARRPRKAATTTEIRNVPLRNVAEFHRATGPAVVHHVNITRTIDVFVNVESGYDVGGVAAEIAGG